jgi:hypothetical protein
MRYQKFKTSSYTYRSTNPEIASSCPAQCDEIHLPFVNFGAGVGVVEFYAPKVDLKIESQNPTNPKPITKIHKQYTVSIALSRARRCALRIGAT